jgi:hypothetical protein
MYYVSLWLLELASGFFPKSANTCESVYRAGTHECSHYINGSEGSQEYPNGAICDVTGINKTYVNKSYADYDTHYNIDVMKVAF